MKISCGSGICSYLFSLCFISVAASVGVAGVFFYAAPIFAELFRNFGADLPYYTQFILDLYPLILLPPLAAFLLCLADWRRKRQSLPAAAGTGKIAWIILWVLILSAVLSGAFAMYLPIFKMCCVV